MSFSSLLNQTISIYNKTGLDVTGREVTSAATSVKANFQRSNKNIMLPNGTVVQIEALIFVKPSVTVNNGDRVSYSGVDYKVVGKHHRIGRTGAVHHLELDVIKWQT